jgi:hypothetical protein
MEGVTGCDWNVNCHSGPTWKPLFRCKVPNLVAQIEVKVVLQVSVFIYVCDFHNRSSLGLTTFSLHQSFL